MEPYTTPKLESGSTWLHDVRKSNYYDFILLFILAGIFHFYTYGNPFAEVKLGSFAESHTENKINEEKTEFSGDLTEALNLPFRIKTNTWRITTLPAPNSCKKNGGRVLGQLQIQANDSFAPFMQKHLSDYKCTDELKSLGAFGASIPNPDEWLFYCFEPGITRSFDYNATSTMAYSTTYIIKGDRECQYDAAESQVRSQGKENGVMTYISASKKPHLIYFVALYLFLIVSWSAIIALWNRRN